MTSSNSAFLTLLDGATADVTGDVVLYNGRSQTCMLYVSGTFGGGSVDIEVKPNPAGSNNPTLSFVDISGGTGISTAECKTIFLPANTYVRAVLSGSSSPNLTVGLFYQ